MPVGDARRRQRDRRLVGRASPDDPVAVGVDVVTVVDGRFASVKHSDAMFVCDDAL